MKRTIAVLTLALLAWAAAAGAADSPSRESSRPFSYIATDWTRLLERAEQQLTGWQVTLDQIEEMRERLASVKAEAEAVRHQALADAAANKKLIDALGALPEPGQPPEAENIAAQRRQLGEEAALFATRAQQAEFTAARAARLLELAGKAARESVARAVLERGNSPFGWTLWSKAGEGLTPLAAALPRMTAEWWRNQAAVASFPWPTLSIVTMAVIGVGVPAGRWLRRRYGRSPDRTPPSPRQRLAAALAASFGPAFLPTLLIGGWFAVLEHSELNVGAFGNILGGLAFVAAAYLMFTGLTRAALAPLNPEWRLVPIGDASALALARIFGRMGLFLALGALAAAVGGATGSVTADLRDAFSFLFQGGIGIYLLELTRRNLWRGQAPSDEKLDAPSVPRTQGAPGGRAALATGFGAQGAPGGRAALATGFGAQGAPGGGAALATGFGAQGAPGGGAALATSLGAQGAPGGWLIVRLAVRLLAFGALAALLGAYYNLGEYLTQSLLLSGFILAGYALLRLSLREIVAAFGDSNREIAIALRRVLSGADDGRRIPFWIGLALQAPLAAGAVTLLLLAWRVPWRVVAEMRDAMARGVTIGGVTISLAGIAASVSAFVLALVVTRLIQRGVRHRILPQTSLDAGVRHSIVVGIGYVGIVVALVAAVAALGLDLTNFALIAGALSVGIGFGLQNVVSNFVSGLILLIERPVKVGDRVVVGGKEGHVRRINVRATEIETSERATVIIPNSEFISTAVTNWTHRDRYGRAEVMVGVAYGSDPEKVRDVLIACAKAHPAIALHPEPNVAFKDFGPSSLDFSLRGFVDDVENKGEVESQLRYAITRAFAENGIVIPFPQREISIKDIGRLERWLGAARGGE